MTESGMIFTGGAWKVKIRDEWDGKLWHGSFESTLSEIGNSGPKKQKRCYEKVGKSDSNPMLFIAI